jgi:hypothetical protein
LANRHFELTPRQQKCGAHLTKPWCELRTQLSNDTLPTALPPPHPTPSYALPKSQGSFCSTLYEAMCECICGLVARIPDYRSRGPGSLVLWSHVCFDLSWCHLDSWCVGNINKCAFMLVVCIQAMSVLDLMSSQHWLWIVQPCGI